MKPALTPKIALARPPSFSKMRSASLALACCIASAMTTTVAADQIRVPLAENVRQGQQQPLPGKGASKADVESRFGEPRRRSAAVGTPPISQWHYDNFVVYFEHDHVIHSAAKRPGG